MCPRVQYLRYLQYQVQLQGVGIPAPVPVRGQVRRMVGVPPTHIVGLPSTRCRLYATGQSELSLLVAWWGLILEPVVCVVLFFHRTCGDVVSYGDVLCQVVFPFSRPLWFFVWFSVGVCFHTSWYLVGAALAELSGGLRYTF